MPLPLSPIAYNGTGQPTLPAGSQVNAGQGPVTTPGTGTNGLGQTQTQANAVTGNYGIPDPKAPPTQDAQFSRLVPDRSVLSPVTNNTDPATVAFNQNQKTESETIAGLQSAVDVVNKQYDNKIADFNSGQGNANAGAERSSGALLGLAGSTAGAVKQNTGAATNNNAKEAINAQRSDAINKLYGQMDSAQDAASKAQSATDAETASSKQSEANDIAENVIRGLGSHLNGASFDQMKSADPQFYQSLLAFTGGNDAKLELLYNSAMPTPVKYDFTSLPGYAVYTDPSTNQPKVINLGITPAADQSLTVTADGTPLLFNKSTGQVSIPPGFSNGQFAKDNYQVVKGTTTTDEFGQQSTSPDRVFDSTKGVFVDGKPGTPPTSTAPTSPTGGAASPVVPQAGGTDAGTATGVGTPGTGANKLDFNQYGLLANTDFNPTTTQDQLAQKYLDTYLKDGTVPTYSSLGRGITPAGFAKVTQRASELYFKATGNPLPSPQIIKGYQQNIIANNKLGNQLQFQTDTVKGNVDLSLDNMTKNGLNGTGFKPLDDLIDNVKAMFQDPNVDQMLAQNTTIQNEIGSLLSVKNAGGTTVYDKLSSAGLIQAGESPDAIKQTLDTLIKEAGIFSDALSSTNASNYAQTDPLLQDANNPARSTYMQKPGSTVSDTSSLPDGTTVQGDDGKTYVIKGGKPVAQ